MITETQINKWLIATRKLSDRYRSEGKIEEANLILNIGSQLAIANLVISGIKSKKVICSFCRKQITSGKEVEFANKIGYCMTCESVRIDVDMDLMEEARQNELN